MKKYIIHYPKLTERKAYIESRNLQDVEWVSKWNREDFAVEPPERYIACPKLWNRKLGDYYNSKADFRAMKPGDLACSENHIETWKMIADTETSLVLEDDAIFCNFFDEIFDQTTLACPNFDVLFVGGAFYHEDVAKTTEQIGNFYKKSHPSTNTVCAYVLSKNAAQKLCKIAESGYTLPIDFEMNYWFDVLGFNVYHHIPYLIREGTNAGFYKTCQQR
jgi:GR25 family glycosyltransferase involved in LPS biosynthesis